MASYGYGMQQAAAMHAAAQAGWGANGAQGFMGQPQQFPNYFQLAQQQNFAQQQVHFRMRSNFLGRRPHTCTRGFSSRLAGCCTMGIVRMS